MPDQAADLCRVAVALVCDRSHRILWTFKEAWGEFALPLTKLRCGTGGEEQPARGALRAAAEVVGVPVVSDRKLSFGPVTHLSGRQFGLKQYSYELFWVEPHPAFADKLQLREPHLWLGPHEAVSGEYEPLSRPCVALMTRLIEEEHVPGRKQLTSILIVKRFGAETQFLLRWHRVWGYTFPAKRRQEPDAGQASALRVAREELGLEPGRDFQLAPAAVPLLKTFGVTLNEEAPGFGAPTDYENALFEATYEGTCPLSSKDALVWVTTKEVLYGWTEASESVPGSPKAKMGRISAQVGKILGALNYLDWIEQGDFLL